MTDDSLNEEWRPVVGYEDHYMVSSLGRVKSVKFNKERILQPQSVAHGYLQVGLTKAGKQKFFRVHTLVARAFLGECPPGYEVNHKSETGDKTDNRADNLEYVTKSQNIRHAIDVLGRQIGRQPKDPDYKQKKAGAHQRRLRRYERRAQVLSLHHQGFNQTEIAKQVGVSQSYVSAILLKANPPTMTRRERDGQILLRHLYGYSQAAIATEFGITQGRVWQILTALKSATPARPTSDGDAS